MLTLGLSQSVHVAQVLAFLALCAVYGCLNVTSTLDSDVGADAEADVDGVGASVGVVNGCLLVLVLLLPTGLFSPGLYSPEVSVPNSSCK